MANEQLCLFPEQIEIERETLVIIGNGFDLAHGIKSSYCDFRDWLGKDDGYNITNLLDIFFSNKRDIWSGIEQALGEYDEESILDFCRPDEEFDWDHSISSAARVEDSPMAIFQPVLDDFKSCFCEWVDSIETKGCEKVFSLSPLCHYLSFNYTDTLETIYDIPDNQIAHIHGYRNGNDDYVIGHNNYRDPSEPWGEDGAIFEQQAMENIITWMNEFQKDYDVNIAKHQVFFDGLCDIKQVITYGHSLGEIDWPYFEIIINIMGKDVPWKVFGHSREDYSNALLFQEHFHLSSFEFKFQ